MDRNFVFSIHEPLYPFIPPYTQIDRKLSMCLDANIVTVQRGPLFRDSFVCNRSQAPHMCTLKVHKLQAGALYKPIVNQTDRVQVNDYQTFV